MPRPESVHLASTHRPFDTRIFHKECKTLAHAGYKVTLIVPHDRDEVVDGIQIRAVPLPKSGKERLLKSIWQIYQAARRENPDAIFHFHDSELLLAMLLLRLQGRRVIYDMHEDTPLQVSYQHWIPLELRKPVALLMRGLEYVGGHIFNGLIAAEPVIAQHFKFVEQLSTIHNFPLLGELGQEAPVPFTERPPHAAYIGTITTVRGIREVVAAMGLLPPAMNAGLFLGGSFHPPALFEEVQSIRGWDRVQFAGWLNRDEMKEALGQVRAGVVTFHPVERYLGNYPTKLFEYMAAGVPVVVSDFPQLRPFVEESRCGILVDPLDPQAIADAIGWLITHPDEAEAMGRRGREAIENKHNWQREAPKLLAFYEAVEAA